MAPEIVLDHGYLGMPVDVWSAAVCLYALVYGTVPFKVQELKELTKEAYDQIIDYPT